MANRTLACSGTARPIAGRTSRERSPQRCRHRPPRDLLDRARYDEAGIRAAGVEPGLGVRRPDIPVLLRALEPAEPISALIRLFLFTEDVDRRDLESRLGADVHALVDAGLLLLQDDRYHPTVALTPWRGRIVVHDPDPEGDLWSDHVGGPTPAADALAGLLVGGEVDTALDLGTGSGLLAMLLADEARSVIATDVNPAAIRYAELGARLNGLPQIEVRSGSFFEPVRDVRFDRICPIHPSSSPPSHRSCSGTARSSGMACRAWSSKARRTA